MLQESRRRRSPIFARHAPRIRLVALTGLVLFGVACRSVLGNVHPAAVLAAGPAGGAAIGALAAKNPGIRAGTPVEVTFKSPRDILLSGSDSRDTSRFRDATILLGRVHHQNGDTLWVAVTRITGKSIPVSFNRSNAPVAMLPPGEGTEVRSLRNTASYVFGGAVIGFILAAPIAVIVAVSQLR